MAGLSAGQKIKKAGVEPLIVEKGRGFGGRMANRRMSEAKFDHGAQFITSRNHEFEQQLKTWEEEGVSHHWEGLGKVRAKDINHWHGIPSMTAIPKALAEGLHIERATRVSALSPQGDVWQVKYEDGTEQLAKQIICTAPVPQTLTLLQAGQAKLDEDQLETLMTIQYDPCFAVMALLEHESFIPSPGILEFDHGPVAWMADNQQKGISPLPAITLHSSGAYAKEHWNDDRLACGHKLLELMKDNIGPKVLEVQVHGWLYSKVTHGSSERFARLKSLPPMWLAGDAFGGPHSVEGAALSGWAVAADLLKSSR